MAMELPYTFSIRKAKAAGSPSKSFTVDLAKVREVVESHNLLNEAIRVWFLREMSVATKDVSGDAKWRSYEKACSQINEGRLPDAIRLGAGDPVQKEVVSLATDYLLSRCGVKTVKALAGHEKGQKYVDESQNGAVSINVAALLDMVDRHDDRAAPESKFWTVARENVKRRADLTQGEDAAQDDGIL